MPDTPGSDTPTPVESTRSAATDRASGWPVPATDLGGKPSGDFLVPGEGRRAPGGPEPRFDVRDRMGAYVGAVEVTSLGDASLDGNVQFAATVEIASEAFDDISDAQLLAKFGMSRDDIGDTAVRVPVVASVTQKRIEQNGGSADAAVAQYTNAAVRGLLEKAVQHTNAERTPLAMPVVDVTGAPEPGPAADPVDPAAVAPTEVLPATLPTGDPRTRAAGAVRELGSAGTEVARDLAGRGGEFAKDKGAAAKSWWGEASGKQRGVAVAGTVAAVWVAWAGIGALVDDDNSSGLPVREPGANQGDDTFAPVVTLPPSVTDAPAAPSGPTPDAAAPDIVLPQAPATPAAPETTTPVVADVAWAPAADSTDLTCAPRTPDMQQFGFGAKLATEGPGAWFQSSADSEWVIVYCPIEVGAPVVLFADRPAGVEVDSHESTETLNDAGEVARLLLDQTSKPVAVIAFDPALGTDRVFVGRSEVNEYRALRRASALGQPAA